MEQSVERLVARIDELETRESFHDYTVEQLNATIIEQQKRLDDLERALQLLANQLKNQTSESPEMRAIIDEKPPHY